MIILAIYDNMSYIEQFNQILKLIEFQQKIDNLWKALLQFVNVIINALDELILFLYKKLFANN